MSLKLIKLHLNSCQDPLINYLPLDASEGEIITVVDGTWLRLGSFGFCFWHASIQAWPTDILIGQAATN